MATPLAVKTAIPDFKIMTGPMGVFDNELNKPLVRMIGSSTEKDLHGDIMALSALQDMTKVDKNLTIWLNHDYTVPDSVFGTLHDTPYIQTKSGIADLFITAEVQTLTSPKAAQTYMQIKNGVKHGCSIGCQVVDYAIEGVEDMSDEEAVVWAMVRGAQVIITHVKTVEWSIVGIPANQRSWVENAMRGLFTRTLDTRLAPAIKTLYPADYDRIINAIPDSHVKETLKSINGRPDKGTMIWNIDPDRFHLRHSIKSGSDGEMTLNRDDVHSFLPDDLLLNQINEHIFHKADDSDKSAQESRSKRYGIGIKESTNVTKPSQWSNVSDANWGDPVNYRYPMPDASHARNALSRWGDASNRSQYSSEEQGIVGGRIRRRARALGVDVQDEGEKGKSIESVTIKDDDTPAGHGISGQAIQSIVELLIAIDNAADKALRMMGIPEEAEGQSIHSGLSKVEKMKTKASNKPLSAEDMHHIRTVHDAMVMLTDGSACPVAPNAATPAQAISKEDPINQITPAQAISSDVPNEMTPAQAMNQPYRKVGYSPDKTKGAGYMLDDSMRRYAHGAHDAMSMLTDGMCCDGMGMGPHTGKQVLEDKSVGGLAIGKTSAVSEEDAGAGFSHHDMHHLSVAHDHITHMTGGRVCDAMGMRMNDSSADNKADNRATPGLTDEGMQHAQRAHNALAMMTDGMVCKGSAPATVNSTTFNDVSRQIAYQRDRDPSVPGVDSGSTMGGTTLGFTPDQMKAFDGFAQFLQDFGAVKKEMENTTSLAATIKADIDSMLMVAKNAEAQISTITSTPLGRPTGFNRSLSSDPTATTWKELEGHPNDVTGTTIRYVPGIGKCRHWPSGVNKENRPALTANQMIGMANDSIASYANGGEALVPYFD